MSTLDISPLTGTKLKESIEIPPEIHRSSEGEIPANHDRQFSVMHPEFGDERLTWSSTSLTQLQEAKKLFVELVKKGLTPYRVGVNGQQSSEVMKEFDPHAEEVIFMPTAAVAGG